MKKGASIRTVRFGSREIVSKGLAYSIWSDIRHRSLQTSWPVFVGGVAVFFVLINLIFAGLYTLGDAPVANSSGTFLDNLFFSIETYATVGYGDMHPRTTYGHVIASVEVFAGLLTSAMITALVFLRFTLIRPRILFADVAPIALHDGRRSLMIRLANERMNAISVAQARMWVSLTYTTAEGAPFRRFEELRLLRHQSPLFALSWTVIHPIDETSPFHGLDEAALGEQEAAVTIVIDGYDETTAQSVRARRTYYIDDLRFGHRYADILDFDGEDRTVLNYARFHATHAETKEPAAAAPAGEPVREPA